jgi:DHA2 family multidrug resistance protein
MKIPYKYAVSLTVALGLFMAVLDNTIVNVSLTAMVKSFNKNPATFQTDINNVQWVITAYFLAQAAVIPVAGYLANLFGIKRMYMLSLILFTVASLLCGLSEQIGGKETGLLLLIIFRILQGIGGGALFPLATSMAFGAFPPEERARSSAITAVPVLFAPALGPTIGGIIVDTIGWQWIFYINIPVGIVALAIIARVVRADNLEELRKMRAQDNFDYLGLFLSMVGITLFVYAFTLVGQTEGSSITPSNPRGSTYGWDYWLVWVLMGAGVLLLTIFAFYQLRIKDPVVDLRLFKERDYTVASVLSWIIAAVVFGSFFLLPLYLEQFKGLSTIDTGLAMMPQGLTTVVAITLGSRLYDIIGPRWLVLMGMTVLTLSSLWLVFIDRSYDGWSFIPILILRGIGFGWSVFPLQTLALSAIVGRALPKASSLYNATRQIFSSIGIAMLSTLFVEELVKQQPLAQQAAAAGQIPANQVVLAAGVNAISHVFLIATVITAIAIVLVFLMPLKSIAQQMKENGGKPARGGESKEKSDEPVPAMEA